MGNKNQLAKKMIESRSKAFEAGGQAALDCVTIALNRTFGFGKERILKLQKEYEKIYIEFYGACLEGKDYGAYKIKQAINQIMQEESRFNQK